LNKKIVIILISAILVLLASGVIFATLQEGSASSFAATSDAIHNINDDDYTYIPPTTTEEDTSTTPSVTEAPFVPATEMDLDPTSITVFVNKEYALPADFQPENMVTPDIYFHLSYYDDRTLMRKEAANAIEDLFAAAKKDGCSLSGVSGYRSYQRQKKIFINNIITKGKTHTLKYSAVPGTSEHQTGLVMDISSASLGYDLNDNFIDTPEGQWVAKNSYRFGFIVRYPDGKADITGYSYEPWHIRYVGKGLAKYLYENDLTLEEYYNYTPSPDFDFEAVYASLINYKPPVTPTTPPITGEDILDENGEIIDGEEDGTTPDGTIPEDTTGNQGGKTPTPSPKPTVAVQDPDDEPTDPEVPVTPTPDPGDSDDGSGTNDGSSNGEGDTGHATPTPDPGLTGAPVQ
jgi:zinc D-Ala-D-Ala carboxypeptidase